MIIDIFDILGAIVGDIDILVSVGIITYLVIYAIFIRKKIICCVSTAKMLFKQPSNHICMVMQ